MKKNSFYVANLGILTAVAITLSFLEGLIPPLSFLPTGAKLGLSNIAVMFSVYSLGALPSIIIVILKSLFVLLTRGISAGFLSLLGGILSAFVMIFLVKAMKKPTFMLISVFSAVFHNIGQLIGAAILTATPSVFYYLPILVIFGILFGSVTGTVLRIIFPYLERIRSKLK